MTVFKYFIFFLISLNFSFSKSIHNQYRSIANKIIANAKTDSTAYKRLEYLCDTYGPRLSGSKNLERSIEWILQKMKQDNLETFMLTKNEDTISFSDLILKLARQVKIVIITPIILCLFMIVYVLYFAETIYISDSKIMSSA